MACKFIIDPKATQRGSHQIRGNDGLLICDTRRFPRDFRFSEEQLLALDGVKYDVEIQDKLPVDVELTRSAKEVARRCGREFPFLGRLRPADLVVRTDEFAMLCPTGEYATFNEKNGKAWPFLTEFRNLMWQELKRDNADDSEFDSLACIGVNYSIDLPVAPDFVYSDQYHAKFNLPDEFCEAWRTVFWGIAWTNWSACKPEDIVVKAKKQTQPGPPYLTRDGDEIKKEMVCYSIDTKVGMVLPVYKLDYSSVKLDGFNHPESFYSPMATFLRSWSFFEKYGEITPNNLEEANRAIIIPMMAQSMRRNCPKSTLQKEDFDPATCQIGDRQGDHSISETQMESFKGKSQVITDYIRDVAGVLGAPNRARRVNNVSSINQYQWNIAAKRWEHGTMDGQTGFLANRDVIKERVKNFCAQHKVIKILTGDRHNAEKYVSSNKDEFAKLYDPGLWRYKSGIQGKMEIMQPDGLNVMDWILSSGKHDTTFDNMIAGCSEICFEVPWTLGVRDPKQIAKIGARICYSIMTGEAEVEVLPGIFVMAFMVTDDMVCWLGADSDFHCEVDREVAEGRQLDLDIVASVVSFGMKSDTTHTEPAESSFYAKAFTGEHMGFTYADGFSTYVKLRNINRPDLINHLLKKHFGSECSIQSYAKYGPLYFSYLVALGIDIDETYNEFSPTEVRMHAPFKEQFNELVKGKLVSNDPTSVSSSLSEETKKEWFDALDNTFLKIAELTPDKTFEKIQQLTKKEF